MENACDQHPVKGRIIRRQVTSVGYCREDPVIDGREVNLAIVRDTAFGIRVVDEAAVFREITADFEQSSIGW